MALRLLPFRQYDEQDVINLFKFGGTPNGSPSETTADSGMLVKVSSSDLSKDPIEYLGSHSLLGSSGYPHVARNGYPQVPLSVEAAGANDVAIGITLNQTLTHDENGENLLRYPQKKAELFAVTSGEAVPVASKGIFTFDESAVEYVNSSNGTSGTTVASATDADWAVDGSKNKIATQGSDGKIILSSSAGSARVVGTVLGTGKRTAQTNRDQFAGSKGGSAHYVVVKVDL
jgi:hypothetical protein